MSGYYNEKKRNEVIWQISIIPVRFDKRCVLEVHFEMTLQMLGEQLTRAIVDSFL